LGFLQQMVSGMRPRSRQNQMLMSRHLKEERAQQWMLLRQIALIMLWGRQVPPMPCSRPRRRAPCPEGLPRQAARPPD